jgi:hypothetical protein
MILKQMISSLTLIICNLIGLDISHQELVSKDMLDTSVKNINKSKHFSPNNYHMG